MGGLISGGREDRLPPPSMNCLIFSVLIKASAKFLKC